jgi:hypothetical protein
VLWADKGLTVHMNDAKAKRTISIAVAYVILCSTAIGMEFRKEADRKLPACSRYTRRARSFLAIALRLRDLQQTVHMTPFS